MGREVGKDNWGQIKVGAQGGVLGQVGRKLKDEIHLMNETFSGGMRSEQTGIPIGEA